MGLTVAALLMMRKTLQTSKKVLSLGYQDILLKEEQVERHFGYKPEKFTQYGGRHGKNYPLPETDEFFEKLGVEHVCVDIVKSRGPEIICDLNLHPQEGVLTPKTYDLVIDGGTLEHCFNIGEAWVKVAHTVKVGGVIFHGNPLSMVNHGFWNICPTAYVDFYEQNNWSLMDQVIVNKHQKFFKSTIDRVAVDPECSNLFMAKRLNGEKPIFPMQSKYKNAA